ncbi:hypothetical protein Xbed_02303 [Xenorhabdus beddingii]|uniref:Uncharacterized protein n=1 Tax=Xenorhabdus beddingii TaxID=40578 RepID=A0A1Y2SMV2_9GAMM|nr:hypothetical protein Xbed_02303 [Xenorhabdus beddingii]
MMRLMWLGNVGTNCQIRCDLSPKKQCRTGVNVMILIIFVTQLTFILIEA